MKKWLIVLFVFALTGCSPRVVSYLNSKSKFKTFETYRIVSPKVDNSQVQGEMSFAFETIRENIISEMDKRSYKLSTVSPDLTLRYELASSTRVETNRQSSLYYPGYQINSRTINEAILLLELYDTRNKLVWQGSYDLNQEKKEKRVNRKLINAIAKIYTTYPHRALENAADPSLTVYEKKKK